MVAIGAATLVYVNLVGHDTYTAAFETTGGAHSGDDVRIAGISVGSVTSLELADDHVEMTFEVDEGIVLGNATTVGVRLLTPVGGHYLSLVPAGDKGLPGGHIPIEHTRVPFTLSDTIEATTPILRDLDGKTLRENAAQLDRAVQAQPNAIRDVVDNLTSLTNAIAERQDDLDKSLKVSDEYVGKLGTDRQILTGLIEQIGIITAKLGAKRRDVGLAADKLYRLFALLDRPILALDQGLGHAIDTIDSIVSTLQQSATPLDNAISAGREFADSMSGLLDGGQGLVIDHSADIVTGTSICVPTPGKVC